MPPRPLKVFLCHAHADRDPVRALYNRLTKDGVDAWLDKAKLLPGQDWELEIRKAVREADVVVVCLSKQFNQAGFRQKEVRLALDTAMEKPEGEIFIIPARLEECDNLESLRKWHWVDLFEEDGYEMLMRALRARANSIDATLQIKKSWLPTTNVQPVKTEKVVEPKKEKKVVKPVNWNNSNKRIAFVVTFIVLAISAMFGLPPLIGRPELTPTLTNTVEFETYTPFVAANNPVPINSSTVIPLPTASTTESSVITDKSQNLYFISADKYLNVLNIPSGKTQQLFHVDGFNDYLNSDGIYTGEYSTVSWLSESEIAIWLSRELVIINIETKDNRILTASFNDAIAISDISSDGYVVFHNTYSWEKIFLAEALIGETFGNLYTPPLLDVGGYRSLFCGRMRPNGDGRIAIVVSEMNGSAVGTPNLAILEIANYGHPIVIKRQVDGCISWSPNGKYIAYGNGKLRNKYTEKNFTKGIFYVDFASGSVTKLSDTDGYYPVWSSDGSEIAFITNGGISLVDVNTKEERQVYAGDVLALLWRR